MNKLKTISTRKKLIASLVILVLLIGLYQLEKRAPTKIRIFQKSQIVLTNLITPENIQAGRIIQQLKTKKVKESRGVLGDCTGEIMDLYSLQEKQSDVFLIGKIIKVTDVDKSKDTTRLKPAKVTYKILIPIKGITSDKINIETYYNLSNQRGHDICCERRPPPLTGAVESIMLHERPDGKLFEKSADFCLTREDPQDIKAQKELQKQNN